MAAWAQDFFGAELLTKRGPLPAAEALFGKRVVCIYFSAQWCPPCQRFTPLLTSVYAAHEAQDVEVVFVSADRDEASFNEYYSGMPWSAIPWAALASGKYKENLSAKYGVVGFPTLIALSGTDGSTIDPKARTMVSRKKSMAKCLEKWTPGDGKPPEILRRAKPKVKSVDAEAVKDRFAAFDTDGSGQISVIELGEALRVLSGSCWTTEAVSKLFNAADVNRDGTLDYNEFLEHTFKDARYKKQLLHAEHAGDGVKLSMAEPLPFDSTLGLECFIFGASTGRTKDAITFTFSLPTSFNFQMPLLLCLRHGRGGDEDAYMSLALNDRSLWSGERISDNLPSYAKLALPGDSLRQGENSLRFEFNWGGQYLLSIVNLEEDLG